MLQERKEQTKVPFGTFFYYCFIGRKPMPRKAWLMTWISIHDFLLQENSCFIAKECVTSTQAATSKICCFFLNMRDIKKKYALFIYFYHHFSKQFKVGVSKRIRMVLLPSSVITAELRKQIWTHPSLNHHFVLIRIFRRQVIF